MTRGEVDIKYILERPSEIWPFDGGSNLDGSWPLDSTHQNIVVVHFDDWSPESDINSILTFLQGVSNRTEVGVTLKFGDREISWMLSFDQFQPMSSVLQAIIHMFRMNNLVSQDVTDDTLIQNMEI